MSFEVIDRDDYRVLHPRPVYLIISGTNDRLNIMSASWVTPLSEEPPRLGLAISRDSLTYSLINNFKEFTVNVVDDKVIDKVWYAGTRSGKDEDKIKALGLELIPSIKVKVPGLLNSLAIIECKMINEINVGDTAFIIADIMCVRVKSKYYNRRYGWNLKVAPILMHVGGRVFTTPGKVIIAKR
ncbi:MAG: flavin reductase family protein [Thermoprotei archaeon]|nr:MAG: flavin reductase family protein [Thermoprotei archaeon]